MANRAVRSFCFTLDPTADGDVSPGEPMNFMLADHPNRLSERLPMLYAGLAR